MDINYYKEYEPIFGSWYIKKMLGEGGFGQVYEIERNELGQTYRAALKVITIPQSQSELNSVRADCGSDEDVTTYYKDVVNDMMNEFVIMSRVKGTSNIVSYEDHQIIPHKDGIGWDIFIRMELLTPILEYFKGKEVTETDVINLGIDICKALELCQKNNIIHRDVKPENIFVSFNGDYKLGDFGIARTVEKTTNGLTRTGSVPYIAPEVWYGKPYGPTVDIYSLGLVMYKLLNHNRAPFMPEYPKPVGYGDSKMATDKRLQGEKIPAPMAASEGLAKVVLKACAYEVSERYQTATEMKIALTAVLNGHNSESIEVLMNNTPIDSEVTEILPNEPDIELDATEILPDFTSIEQEVTELLPKETENEPEVTEILPDDSGVDPDVTQTVTEIDCLGELVEPILQKDDEDAEDNEPENVVNKNSETEDKNGAKKCIIIAAVAVLIVVMAIMLLLPKGVKDITGIDEKIKLTEGDKKKLEYQIEPAKYSDEMVVFESSDESVFKVNENGVITAEGKGKAVLIITVGDYSEEVEVVVKEKKEDETEPSEEVNSYTPTKSYNKEYEDEETEPAEKATEPATSYAEPSTEAAVDATEDDVENEEYDTEEDGEWWYYEGTLYVPQ